MNVLICSVRFGVRMKIMPTVMKKNPKETRPSQSVPFGCRSWVMCFLFLLKYEMFLSSFNAYYQHS